MTKWNNTKSNFAPLTDLQKEIITGCLLGDAQLCLGERCLHPYLKIQRKLTDRPYLEWQYNKFANISSNIKETSYFDDRTNKRYYSCYFLTYAHPDLLSIYNKWYPNKKIVPSDIILTPLIVAIWFADDGYIRHFGKNELRLSLATDGFSHDDVLLLSKLLEDKLGKTYFIYHKGMSKNNEPQYVITGQSDATYALIKYMEPAFNQLNMDRKNVWSNIDLSFSAQSKRSSKYYEIAPIILKLNSFYVRDLAQFNIYKSKTAISDALFNFFNQGYFTRTQDKMYNSFCYTLTDLGIKYFTSLTNQTNNK